MELSEDFVMVNLGDDEEPSDPKYKPDGGYIPRYSCLAIIQSDN